MSSGQLEEGGSGEGESGTRGLPSVPYSITRAALPHSCTLYNLFYNPSRLPRALLESLPGKISMLSP